MIFTTKSSKRYIFKLGDSPFLFVITKTTAKAKPTIVAINDETITIIKVLTKLGSSTWVINTELLTELHLLIKKVILIRKFQ